MRKKLNSKNQAKYGIETIYLSFHTWNSFQYLFSQYWTLLFPQCDSRHSGLFFLVDIFVSAAMPMLYSFNDSVFICCCVTYSKPPITRIPFYIRNHCVCVFILFFRTLFILNSRTMNSVCVSYVFECVLYISFSVFEHFFSFPADRSVFLGQQSIFL